MTISGVGIGMAAGGAFIAYVAITDQPPATALRSLLKGQVRNATTTPQPPAVGTSDTGTQSALATVALKYVGRPYQWGKNFDPPNGGGDCSGLVYRAFHDLGYNTPRLPSWGYRTWPAVHVDSQIQSGDIIWYRGHVAIAVTPTTMVEAPTFGVPVRVAPIRKGYTALTPVLAALDKYRPATSRGKAF